MAWSQTLQTKLLKNLVSTKPTLSLTQSNTHYTHTHTQTHNTTHSNTQTYAHITHNNHTRTHTHRHTQTHTWTPLAPAIRHYSARLSPPDMQLLILLLSLPRTKVLLLDAVPACSHSPYLSPSAMASALMHRVWFLSGTTVSTFGPNYSCSKLALPCSLSLSHSLSLCLPLCVAPQTSSLSSFKSFPSFEGGQVKRADDVIPWRWAAQDDIIYSAGTISALVITCSLFLFFNF